MQVLTEKEKALQQRFTELYAQACTAKLCDSTNTFADLIGVHPHSVSSAFSGKRISEKMVFRAETKLAGLLPCVEITIKQDNSGNAHDNEQKIFDTPDQPATGAGDVHAIVRELTQALKEERESHERIVMAMIDAFKKEEK